jgi:hydroxyethylthiazole kinase-like uncharacterized protein yjeF
MRAAYTAAEIRAAEQSAMKSLPDGALMQRAATGLARRCAALLDHVYGSRVVVLAGTGNNGGDALYAGGLLARRGARVEALVAGEEVHAEGLAALLAAGGRATRSGTGEDERVVDAADLVIDGMLGIGARGALRPPQEALAALLRSSAALVVAVDVPSGVDASTGEVDGAAVDADVTVTFGGGKVGLFVAPGAGHAGVVEVVDIGLDLPESSVTLLDMADVADLLPAAAGETDKYRRGVLGVVAGSDRYPGAAVLAVGGALATGVGMVRFVSTAQPAELVRQRWPETVVTAIEPGDGAAIVAVGQVQAWVVGSGLGTDDAAETVVRAVLDTDVPVLADADAITVLAAHPEWVRSRTAATVLTPHAGEFARLTGADREDVERHRLDHVRRAAADLGATVLLKGSTTLVADAQGRVRVNSADTPYLATAGSGDVLSGICGALLAGGLSAFDAASVGAFVHGLSGLRAAGVPAVAITATDLVAHVPGALRTVRD